MKVKQLIKIAEAITGKLPADMYELDEVEHKSYHRDEPIKIADMDVVYLVRAFRHQERMLNRQVNKDVVSENVRDTLLQLARERDMWKEKAMNMVDKQTYEAVMKSQSRKGCNYVFSEIPNDTDGQEFVDSMKRYLNKDSYKMRVRGQHVKEELKGTGVTYWGQGLNESSHMRVYVDVK